MSHIGGRSKRLVAYVGLLSGFDEAKWVDAPVPVNGYFIHFQSICESLAISEHAQQLVTTVPNEKAKQIDPAHPMQALTP